MSARKSRSRRHAGVATPVEKPTKSKERTSDEDRQRVRQDIEFPGTAPSGVAAGR